jgi:CPA2 family monovalent cation:H+ antiporter-2
MLMQMSINLALMAGIFLAATIVERQELPWLMHLPEWTGGGRAVLWLAAVLLCLPIGIATLRKLQAFSMLTSEMTVQRRASAKATMAMRALVANTTLFTGIVGLAILLLLFTSFLLPPSEVLLVVIGIVIVVALLLRTFFIRIYSRAQVSIREVLSREPEQTEPALPRRLPSLLENAQLLTVTIRAGTVAVGKQIRELELRTRTGATAVAIRRGTETIISPEPELEFRPDDELLLIGSAVQLEQARGFLDSKQL